MSDEVERLRAELAWVRSVVALHQQNGCGAAISRIGEALGGDRAPYPDSGIRYSRGVLVDTLVHHQRADISGCGCGWAVLGASHAEHIVDVYEESINARGPA